MTTYYKFLREDGRAPFQHFWWSLPTKGEDGAWIPGDWMPAVEGDLKACYRGYHAATPGQMAKWKHQRLFVIEYDEEPIGARDKVVGRRARLLYEVEAWTRDHLLDFMAATTERLLGMIRHHTPRAIACIRKDLDLARSRRTLGWWEARDRRGERRLVWRGIRHEGTSHLLGAAASMAAELEHAYIPCLEDFLDNAATALAHLSPRNLTYDAARDELVDDLLVHLGEPPVTPRAEAA
jgi:hypothetical protein